MGPIAGERIVIGQLQVIFYASADETNSHADVFEVIVPEGARVPVPHHHVEVDEVVYALEGTLTYSVAGQVYKLRAGDRVLAPKGVEHHFANLDPGAARFLSVLTPAKIGRDYFREMAALINAGGPPDPAKLKETMLRHGLVPSPPRPTSS
jgi:quercetin dioxygenase-like cupin family protein